VHHKAGPLETIIDEVGRLVEIFGKVESIMVLAWHVEEIRDIVAGMA
jgi:hypothetical protein